MTNVLEISGNTAGALGILLCLVAGIARIAGYYYVCGYESITLFTGGTSLMIAACLIKLQQLLAASKAAKMNAP